MPAGIYPNPSCAATLFNFRDARISNIAPHCTYMAGKYNSRLSSHVGSQLRARIAPIKGPNSALLVLKDQGQYGVMNAAIDLGHVDCSL